MSSKSIRQELAETEARLTYLKEQLAKIEKSGDLNNPQPRAEQATSTKGDYKWPLTAEEYNRYGRQMIVPSIGNQGQLRLKAAKVLIVGAGGLGCPAALYIAGAGVGTLGLIDGDTVELSNLHRQVLHTTETIGMYKVDSAVQHLKKFNPNVTYETHSEHLTPANALSIFTPYDLILDCTDHPLSRYLISDTCILLSKPLISAAALKTDGQLLPLNYLPRPAGDPSGGLCYRCVFPKPPPADQLVSCADGGIIGPVVGTMGVLQALEAIKLIVAGVSVEDTTHSEFEVESNIATSRSNMLVFTSQHASTPFRSLKMRPRRPDCFACSKEHGLTRESLEKGELDYVAFCGSAHPLHILTPEERVSASKFAKLREAGKKEHVLIDVREKVQFDICHLDDSINIPFSTFQGRNGGIVRNGGDGKEEQLGGLLDGVNKETPIYVICRMGNDSQAVVKGLKEIGIDNGGKRWVGDVEGGFRAWKKEVDESWPEY